MSFQERTWHGSCSSIFVELHVGPPTRPALVRLVDEMENDMSPESTARPLTLLARVLDLPAYGVGAIAVDRLAINCFARQPHCVTL